MSKPSVSIVIPSLNAERFLHQSLASVQNQTFRDFEIILCDGGSTDNTLKIAAGFSKTKIIRQKDEGLAGAWNDGIRASEGDYIAFLDSDDLWEDHCLENHWHVLTKNREYWGSLGHVEFFIENGEEPPKGFKRTLLVGKHLAHMPGCFMGRKALFERTGYFETRWEIASDLVWFAKLKQSGLPVGIISETVLKKRVHGNNLSYTTAEKPVYNKELLLMLRELIKK